MQNTSAVFFFSLLICIWNMHVCAYMCARPCHNMVLSFPVFVLVYRFYLFQFSISLLVLSFPVFVLILLDCTTSIWLHFQVIYLLFLLPHKEYNFSQYCSACCLLPRTVNISGDIGEKSCYAKKLW